MPQELTVDAPRGRGRPRKTQRPLSPQVQWLRNLRREWGFTQEQMADVLCLATMSLSSIECGRVPPSRRVITLAERYFECPAPDALPVE